MHALTHAHTHTHTLTHTLTHTHTHSHTHTHTHSYLICTPSCNSGWLVASSLEDNKCCNGDSMDTTAPADFPCIGNGVFPLLYQILSAATDHVSMGVTSQCQDYHHGSLSH